MSDAAVREWLDGLSRGALLELLRVARVSAVQGQPDEALPALVMEAHRKGSLSTAQLVAFRYRMEHEQLRSARELAVWASLRPADVLALSYRIDSEDENVCVFATLAVVSCFAEEDGAVHVACRFLETLDIDAGELNCETVRGVDVQVSLELDTMKDGVDKDSRLHLVIRRAAADRSSRPPAGRPRVAALARRAAPPWTRHIVDTTTLDGISMQLNWEDGTPLENPYVCPRRVTVQVNPLPTLWLRFGRNPVRAPFVAQHLPGCLEDMVNEYLEPVCGCDRPSREIKQQSFPPIASLDRLAPEVRVHDGMKYILLSVPPRRATLLEKQCWSLDNHAWFNWTCESLPPSDISPSMGDYRSFGSDCAPHKGFEQPWRGPSIPYSPRFCHACHATYSVLWPGTL